MKKMNIRIIAILVVSLLFVGATQIQAQKAQNKGKVRPGLANNIPDLTEEQQTKIEDLRVKHQKKMLVNRNLVMEKRAKLNTLRTADKVDMNAINKVVDEIGALQTQMMKDREANRQEVRNLLNEKQKVFFDSRRGRSFNKGKGGIGRGTGRGYNRMGVDCPRR